jgi:hypothetical protein
LTGALLSLVCNPPGAFQLTIFHLSRKNNHKISVVPTTFPAEAPEFHQVGGTPTFSCPQPILKLFS